MKIREGDKITRPIEQILSCTTGTLLCEIEHVYEIMSFAVGQDLMTHQLPRAFEVCIEYWKEKHPELFVMPYEVSKENYKQWLEEAKKVIGETGTVSKLPEGLYEKKNPIAELVEKMSTKQ